MNDKFLLFQNAANDCMMYPLSKLKSVEAGSTALNFTFDTISGEGEDFRNENFGLQMETGLTEDNPHSAFLYVRSKQTLVFNANGLQVIN